MFRHGAWPRCPGPSIGQARSLRRSARPVVIGERRPALTPTVLTKGTTQLLALACDAVLRLGAIGVLIMPEEAMDWEAVRDASRDVQVLVAIASHRHLEAVRKAGLIPVEVEGTEAPITERITLALIEAVAADQLKAGARVVVLHSGFETGALDSLT